MIIKQAIKSDAVMLVELAKAMGYETEETGVLARVSEITNRPDHCLLVAKEGENIVGFCHGYIRLLVEVDKAVEIGGLAVIPEWQGKGVARKLVEGIEEWAKKISLKWIVLSSNVKRTQAHGFFMNI